MILSTAPVDENDLDRAREEFDHIHVFSVTDSPIQGVAERIRFELDPSYLNTDAIRVTESERGRMIQLLDQHDFVWVHTIKTANAFRILHWPNSLLDVDDLPSRVYASRARAGLGSIRGLLDLRMSGIWWRRERAFRTRFGALGVCSDADRKYLGGDGNIFTIRNGFSMPRAAYDRPSALPPRIGFIGWMRYTPNRSGVEWFIRHVWPLVKRQNPHVRLRLVGSGSERGLAPLGPDIDGLGYLEDPSEEIASWSAMIVPLKVGGGTRMKIAEAFSRRCPVVSTTLGAFGHELRNGEEILLADSARAFAQACVDLITNPELSERITANAWAKFLGEWTWDSIGRSVEAIVQSCLSSRVKTSTESHEVHTLSR